MSVSNITMITCDGHRVGTGCANWVNRAVPPQKARKELAKVGWTRRHHGDIQIDLCPKCSPIAVLAPNTCGRPRKTGLPTVKS